jgi:hypothetical protein
VFARHAEAAAAPLAVSTAWSMAMSARFEGKSWSAVGIGGVMLVVLGQWMLLRTRPRSGLAE